MDRTIAPGESQDSLQPVPDRTHKFIVDHHRTTSQIDELEEMLSQFVSAQRLVPMTRMGELDSAFQFHGTQELGFFGVHFGQKLSIDFPPQDVDDRHNNIAFVMASKGNAQLRSGRDEFAISEVQGLVFSAGPTHTLQFSEDCDARALFMDRQRLSEHCAKLLGRDLDKRLNLETCVPLGTGSGHSWLRTVQHASAELSYPDSPIRYVPAAWQHLEHLLFTSFLLGHRHNYSEALLQPQPAAVPFYVKRAEAYIEAYFAEPLSLADIASHAGISARSLQNGFQNFRGMTPMAFLRSVRLQKAHHTLRVADPTVSTVAEIAFACGFTHMGEFGTAYRRTFGATPRQTLLKGA
ncbi:AraC family transcriptional regulator [Microvirga puerhi]|uniref:AraC family transcriptional regulator n=1 Tax=Microvirga puerhi TaxID=2876078 RepID=A0ABS7VN59_9HYPH|nr:AraC family transcriptional regulator [Microvirga puerhi]MBZ6076462.1 AraC family transcriptional regulator [Microvirga puerhi]